MNEIRIASVAWTGDTIHSIVNRECAFTCIFFMHTPFHHGFVSRILQNMKIGIALCHKINIFYCICYLPRCPLIPIKVDFLEPILLFL